MITKNYIKKICLTIFQYVFRRHTGLIYICNLNRVKKENTEMSTLYKIYVATVNDSIELSTFYYEMGRTNFTPEYIMDNIKMGNIIYFVKEGDRIIASNWLLVGDNNLNGFSRYVLIEKLNSNICLDQDTLYSCYIVVRPEFRGMGIYEQLQERIIRDQSCSSYKRIVLTTGKDNWIMIHCCSKYFEICGIVEIRLYLNWLLQRKVISLNERLKCWYTVDNDNMSMQ